MRAGIPALLFLPCLFGQQFTSSNVHVWPDRMTLTVGAPRPMAVVKGAPYSAEQIQESPQGKVYTIGRFERDSQGRERSETAAKPAAVWFLEILDPVAGAAYLLDPDNRVAHRMALAVSAAATESRPPWKSEPLGSQVIEGVVAQGTRASGPLTLEFWDSPELKLNLVTRSSNGYSTLLRNLSRAEPDPSHFRPPADYAVADHAGPFPFALKVPQ